MLYPQNGDRIVTIDSVTSLDPMYSVPGARLGEQDGGRHGLTEPMPPPPPPANLCSMTAKCLLTERRRRRRSVNYRV